MVLECVVFAAKTAIYTTLINMKVYPSIFTSTKGNIYLIINMIQYKLWYPIVSEDLRLPGLNTQDAQDCVRWRSEIRQQPNPALSGKTGFKH